MSGIGRRAAFAKRDDGEGRSTAELFAELRAGLRALETRMEKRHGRDQASALLSDCWVAMQEIAERFGSISPHFSERPVAPVEDEEDMETRETGQVSLAEVLRTDSDEEQELDEAMTAELHDFHAAYESMQRVKVLHFRQHLEFLTRGCRQAEDVARKVVAMVRRVQPELLRGLGISQVAVSRKFGEQRATTSAREKRVVEEPLRAVGAKGYLGIGGTKTASHREKCRAAQQGNTNRRDAEARRRAGRDGSENISGQPTKHRKSKS